MHARDAVLKVGNVTTCQFVENIVSFAISPPRGGVFAVLRERFCFNRRNFRTRSQGFCPCAKALLLENSIILAFLQISNFPPRGGGFVVFWSVFLRLCCKLSHTWCVFALWLVVVNKTLVATGGQFCPFFARRGAKSRKKPSTIFQKLLKLLVFCIIIYVYYYAHKAV